MQQCFKGYGLITSSISLFLFHFLSGLIFASPANAEDNPYAHELIASAKEMRLSQERYWEILLHDKNSIFGVKSLIDDPRFFLSPQGKEDPGLELEATLRGFFQDDPMDDTHPQCRFVARYAYLKEKLAIDESRLPNVVCKEFLETMDKINPKSAVFVFPAAYMNSPASMFGHTLLRIDSAYQSKLISYAANYAALADDTNGLFYAFKGIFGYYKGYFSILPYYEKVQEYNDMEQRDMWEYHLNLSEEETKKMVMHLWELKEIYSSYYFFDENCSYNLLFLLEAARPTLHLTDRFGLWVMPVDTLLAVQKSGLVDSVEYRPSKATRIRHIASLMDEKAQDLSLKIANRESAWEDTQILEKEEQIKVLDLSTEIVQFKYNKKQLSKDEYTKQFLSLLTARSQLGRPEDAVYTIEPPPPEAGHDSNLLAFGIGTLKDDLFQEIKYRPAYHDLNDPDEGYVEGSQIIFGEVSVRYYFDARSLKLESLDLIDIVSLSPRDTFSKPVSWKIKTGLFRKTFSDHERSLVYELNPGGGVAFKNRWFGLLYLLFESDLNVSGKFEESYSLGIGPTFGTIKEITDFYKINLSLEAIYYELGDKHRRYNASIVQSLNVSRNNSISLDLSRSKSFDTYQTEVKLNWNLHF